MKIKRLMLLIPLLFQFAILTSVRGSDVKLLKAHEDIPVTTPNEKEVKEEGMTDTGS